MEVKEVKEHKKDARRFASSALERGPDWIFFISFTSFTSSTSCLSKIKRPAEGASLPAK